MQDSIEFALMIWGGIIAAFLICLLFARFIFGTLAPFLDRRNYLREQIMFTHGEEKEHWKRELRRLYIKQIPLIGKPIVKAEMKHRRRKMRKQRRK